MKKNRALLFSTLIISALIFFVVSCEKTGSLKGRIVNTRPDKDLSGVAVSAVSDGKVASTVDVDPKTGDYVINALKPGIYDIRLKMPLGIVEFNYGIKVVAGNSAVVDNIEIPPDAFPPPQTTQTNQTGPATESAQLNPTQSSTIEAAKPPAGTGATVIGTVYPPTASVNVLDGMKVIAKGAAVSGKFSVQNVPPGVYDVEFSAPGYANQTIRSVAVAPEGVTAPLSAFMLYRAAIDGVDYDKGVVVATGLGKPNPQMPAAQAGLMACRAAKVVAYRNLLDALANIQVEKGKSIKQLGNASDMQLSLKGFVQGAKVLKENKTPQGVCEVTLEINLYGPSGVTNYIKKGMGK